MKNHRIFIGQWVFFPEHLIARNMHNGSPVYFRRRPDGAWIALACNIPAEWMFREICDWFNRWINGEPAPAIKTAER